VTEDYLTGSRLDGATEQSIFLAKAEHYRNISKSSQAALTTIDYNNLLQQLRGNLTDLIHLSPEECRNAYSSLKMPSEFSNVLLVTSSNISNTIDGFVDGDLLFPEMAAGPKYEDMQTINWVNANGTTSIFHKHCVNTSFDFGIGNTWNVPVWDYYCTVAPYRVDYCLAQKFEFGCGVGFNTRVLVGIIVCLVVEVGCLISLAFTHGFRPLGILTIFSTMIYQADSFQPLSEMLLPAS
jgi:hypothetical protein